jgi:flagellar L-ring protein FlgH
MRRTAMVAIAALGGLALAGCRFEGFQSTDLQWQPLCNELGDGNGPGENGSLFKASSDMANLIKQARGYQPCDTLTVEIQEQSEASTSASTDTERTTSSGVDVDVMANLFQLGASSGEGDSTGLDWGNGVHIGGGSKTTNNGKGETSRKNVFDAKVTVMVVDVFDNGLLEVEGARQITVNNEVQLLHVHGYLDPRHATGQDMVPSWRLAYPTIALLGQGVVGDKQIAPWLQRALDRIAPL